MPEPRKRWPRPRRSALDRNSIMTAAEVAELLRMPRSTVEDYARRDVLPSIKLGRHRRFVRADIERHVDRQRPVPARRPVSAGR